MMLWIAGSVVRRVKGHVTLPQGGASLITKRGSVAVP
jgi:hypothetical protein